LTSKEAGITAHTYYPGRKEHGGLKLDQAKCLKDQEKQDSKLRQPVAELLLEKQTHRSTLSASCQRVTL